MQDLQRGDQLRMGKPWAPSFVGQGRQGVDHRLAALELAEVALHAPHRHQRLAIDAITLLDALQDLGILLDQALAFVDPQWRQRAIEVFPHGTGEFRLAAIGLDHAHVRTDPDKRTIEQIATDP